MCGAQRSRKFNFYGRGPKESGNSINRDWIGKRKLFFHSWWQREKTISSIRKTFADAKGKNETIHTFRVASVELDAAPFRRDDGGAMKILCFLALVSTALAAEPAATVFVNGNIYTMDE